MFDTFTWIPRGLDSWTASGGPEGRSRHRNASPTHTVTTFLRFVCFEAQLGAHLCGVEHLDVSPLAWPPGHLVVQFRQCWQNRLLFFLPFFFFFQFSVSFFFFKYNREGFCLGHFLILKWQLVAILAILVLLSLVPTKHSLCSFHCLSIDGMSGLVAFLPDLGHRAQLCNSFVARCRCLVILVETKCMSHRFCPTDYFELIIDTKIG